MAQFTYYPDKVFLEQLNKLADEKLAERVLKAGGGAMVPYLKSSIRSAVKNGTGDLEKSIKVSKVKTDKDGNKIVYILPTGKDRHGVSNMAKLAYIEYGVRSANRAPQPFLVKLVKDSETEIMSAMQDKLDEVLSK